MSSDQGLCGAIHSSVAKHMKNEAATHMVPGKEVMLFEIGDKIKGICYRTHAEQFLVTFKDVGRKPTTFEDVSVIALELLNSGFIETEEKPFFSLTIISSAESMSAYDDIDANVLQNYQEYNLANIIYYSLQESTTSEQSATTMVMDNASKNTFNMIEILTLTFNHTYQAVITKELIEIISGAAALD
jgi:F-type H+-transporting ATPase subunit gamma